MFGALMDKTVSVQRDTVAQDASGGSTRTWSNVATGVTAAIQAASSRTVEDYARRGIRITNIVYSQYDFDTKLSGGLRTGDRIIESGTTYVVQGVNKDSNAIISPLPLYKIVTERLVS